MDILRNFSRFFVKIKSLFIYSDPYISITRAPNFIVRSKPGKRIKINIAGQVFRTYEDTLDRMPDTLLGDKERRQEFYDDEGKEYFFDRHRESFPAILYFYQSDGIMGAYVIFAI